MQKTACYFVAITIILFAFAASAVAQTASDENSEKALEKYRAMISDPMSNPGYLAVDSGEALWATKRGPKNTSLETCDLGEGPGKVDGAYAKLPRYFADVDQVMDAHPRILWVYGDDPGHRHRAAAQEAVRLLGRQSRNRDRGARSLCRQQVERGQIRRQDGASQGARDGGARRSAVLSPFDLNDFSCQTCHSQEGQRIRLQKLPFFNNREDAQATMGSWPTYRVSQASLRTMQHRIWDCYWQMRMPSVGYTSEVTVALISYLTKKAEGGVIEVPSIKR